MPALTPVTIPTDGDIVATEASLLLHVPPDVVLARLVVDPAHASAVPVITFGIVFTVTVAVAMQPPASA